MFVTVLLIACLLAFVPRCGLLQLLSLASVCEAEDPLTICLKIKVPSHYGFLNILSIQNVLLHTDQKQYLFPSF